MKKGNIHSLIRKITELPHVNYAIASESDKITLITIHCTWFYRILFGEYLISWIMDHFVGKDYYGDYLEISIL